MFRMILSSVVIASVLVGANVNAQVNKPAAPKTHGKGEVKPETKVLKGPAIGEKARVEAAEQAKRNEALKAKVDGLKSAATAENINHLSNNSGDGAKIRGEAAKFNFLNNVNVLSRSLDVSLAKDGKVNANVNLADLNRVEELARKSPARFEGLNEALSLIGKVETAQQTQFQEFTRAMFDVLIAEVSVSKAERSMFNAKFIADAYKSYSNSNAIEAYVGILRMTKTVMAKQGLTGKLALKEGTILYVMEKTGKDRLQATKIADDLIAGRCLAAMAA